MGDDLGRIERALLKGRQDMIKRFCDFCNSEMSIIDGLDRTSKTQHYTLNKDNGNEVDICNDCLTKIVNVSEKRWPCL